MTNAEAEITDIMREAVKERDAWNRWSVELAGMLNVSCRNFDSDVVAKQYEELRGRIAEAIKARSQLAVEP